MNMSKGFVFADLRLGKIEAWIGDRRYLRVARNWRKEKRHEIFDVKIGGQLRRVRYWHGIWIVEDSFWDKNGKRKPW